MTSTAVYRTKLPGLPDAARGKVRDVYDLGDALLLVATDRLSAFDVILPDGIPGKGAILTQMSNWWFAQTSGLIQNHLLPDQGGISGSATFNSLATALQSPAASDRRRGVLRLDEAFPIDSAVG